MLKFITCSLGDGGNVAVVVGIWVEVVAVIGVVS